MADHDDTDGSIDRALPRSGQHCSATSALQAFLARLTLRSVLNEEERGAIMGLKGRFDQIALHTDFITQGDHVSHSCLIVDGLAGRFGENSEGARQIICLHIPGDMADLPSVVSPKSAWGLSALTNTSILRVPHTDLRRIAARYPGIAEAFWRDCVADGSRFSEWVVNLGRRDAITRVSHLLCEMAIRYERAGQGAKNAFTLPISQSDLADATGLTSVHVNRTLQEMRRRSLIIANGKTITIPDWHQLAATAEFDDGFLLLDDFGLRITDVA